MALSPPTPAHHSCPHLAMASSRSCRTLSREGSVWMAPSAPAAWESGLCRRGHRGDHDLELLLMRCPTLGPSTLALTLTLASGGEEPEVP